MQRLRASAVCVHAGALLCVRMRDPLSQVARPFVPGGGVEPGESAAATAAREAFEETGYRVVIDEAASVVARYPYVWAGTEFDVTTHFFRARLADENAAAAATHDAFFNEGACWVPLEQLDRELGFDRNILAAIRALLP